MDGWMKFIAGNPFLILFFCKIYDLALVMYAFQSTFMLLLYSFPFGFDVNKLFPLHSDEFFGLVKWTIGNEQ